MNATFLLKMTACKAYIFVGFQAIITDYHLID
ncbi:hypothetical protein MHA_1818 [Mannheimia haemolytica PHL213]|nr:hypothetical protein MHA_1818 [Mannheimia haemolytica PHL213]